MNYCYPKKIRHDRSTGWRPRRAAVLACATILTSVGMVAAGKAPSAWACDTSDHCYAVGQAVGGDNYGELADINISCLYINDASTNFVTNELWDSANSNPVTYWEEDGAISGAGTNGYNNRELFWADSRPNGGGYHFHPIAATGDDSYLVEITWVGNDTWDVYSDGTFWTSTDQPMYSDGAVTFAGSEYTVNSDQDSMRDVGSVSSVEWQSSNGSWHLEGGSMSGVTLGPGPWISPSYSPSSSTASWSGPC
jgi:hypothetical protein